MADLANRVIIQNGSPNPFGKGNGFVIEGDFPISSSAATCPVGNLSSTDLVEIVAVQAVANAKGFSYDRAGSTTSQVGQGIVSIKTIDGANGPAATQTVQVRVFRTT